MRRDERVTDEMVEAACIAALENYTPWHHEAWNVGEERANFRRDIRAAISAALSIEQTEPVAEPAWWLVATDMGKVIFNGHDKARAERVSEMQGRPITPLYAHPPVSALVNAQADEDVVENGDLPQAPWPASDWAIARIDELEADIKRVMGVLMSIAHTFTEDSHGGVKTLPASDYQATARSALSSLRPAEVGSATNMSGIGGGDV